MRAGALIGLMFLSGFAWSLPPEGRGSLHLKTLADIPLPGPATRFDYESYDARAHLLFIAHLGASTLIAFDTRSAKVLAEVHGLSRVHGVLALPALHRVYASATGMNRIVVLDERGFTELARISAGVYPDGMAFAPAAHKVYVSDEAGRTETAIDVRTNRRVATIALGGEAGNSQYDPVSGNVFVNVQTRNELAEIDPATDAIVARIPLPGAKHNHGLLIDPLRHLAYIACDGNQRLLVLDLDRRKVVAHDSLGAMPDVMALDSELGLLYVASESGVVSVFRQTGKTVQKVSERFVAAHAHSIAVDPGTHRVYLPLQDVRGRPVLRVMVPQWR
ncbi:MAG: YncE family protein [Betaproteobacteria bacterium]|nr:YncE family protein [Betaproteobacteria bacterium]